MHPNQRSGQRPIPISPPSPPATQYVYSGCFSKGKRTNLKKSYYSHVEPTFGCKGGTCCSFEIKHNNYAYHVHTYLLQNKNKGILGFRSHIAHVVSCAVRVYLDLDDFLVTASFPEPLLLVTDFMTSWGLTLNRSKSILTSPPPTTRRLPGSQHRPGAAPARGDGPPQGAGHAGAISGAPHKSVQFAERLAAFMNFLRPVTKVTALMAIACNW